MRRVCGNETARPWKTQYQRREWVANGFIRCYVARNCCVQAISPIRFKAEQGVAYGCLRHSRQIGGAID